MDGAGRVNGERLKSLVARIESLEEEKTEIGQDIGSIYKEAKDEGFDTGILKEIIRMRRKTQEQLDEHEMLLDTYMHALGMGGSEREPSLFDGPAPGQPAKPEPKKKPKGKQDQRRELGSEIQPERETKAKVVYENEPDGLEEVLPPLPTDASIQALIRSAHKETVDDGSLLSEP
jgi:uncharacterized protein (UPF0335 family)